MKVHILLVSRVDSIDCLQFRFCFRKYEWQDINQEPIRKKRSITQSIYKNNFDDFINKTETTKVGEYVQEESPVLYGPWDCIIYVSK